ncbi:hypothetical protein DRQ09_09020, partial [candidate division KSB1 bacterium]
RSKYEKYLKVKKLFKLFTISVPRTLTGGLYEINNFLYYIPDYDIDSYYEKDTGFKRIEETSIVF